MERDGHGSDELSQEITDERFQCSVLKVQEKINIRPVGQAVKTSPFHGGNTSSILVRVIFLDSSMVEHSAVNRVVAGSSPARGV